MTSRRSRTRTKNRGVGQKSADPMVHPALVVLLLLVMGTAFLRYALPERSRQRAIEAASTRLVPVIYPNDEGEEEEEETLEEPTHMTPANNAFPFEPWYLDDDLEGGYCALDYQPSPEEPILIRHQRFRNGIDLYLSTQDLAFMVWVAYTYHLNPHFLLGVMMAESAGNCAAVSSAGAQGCFQITYHQGAGQLTNSFKERVAWWYWAPRTSGQSVNRKAGELLGYWPSDLYIPPDIYFGPNKPKGKGESQLRMTHDPVATLMTSRKQGDVPISSVANFSFGVIGSALYYHFLNHYLYSHWAPLGPKLPELVEKPGLKTFWMAASYNQGSPRTMKQLMNWGPQELERRVRSDVLTYGDTVNDYCEQLQLGNQIWRGEMTFGQFSDFLQQLRWTYSNIPIDWETMQDRIKKRYFRKNSTIRVESDLPAIFETMSTMEPRLRAEIPVIDHRVKG